MKFHYTYWKPRILAIILIFFTAIVSRRVFNIDLNIANPVIEFFIFLTPTYILIAATIYAWHHEKEGGIYFLALSILFALLNFSNNNFTILTSISLITFLIGILFILREIESK
tara:strand:+ start:527 stop:865 length:339 start_codon:yes stop_codon:yes gene_type:complete